MARRRFVFRFLDAHNLVVEVDGTERPARDAGGDRRTYQVDNSTLLIKTLTTLGWYIESADDAECDEQLVGLLGRCLFELLFSTVRDDGTADDRRVLRTQFLESCRSQSTEISLTFDDKALLFAQLPWEFLWVPDSANSESGQHVAGKPNVAVTMSRFIPAQDPLIRTDGVLKVLHVTYGPSGMPEIDSRLSAHLAEKSTGRLVYEPLRGEQNNPEAIRSAIAEFKPDVFHFSGHGERDALWLANVADRQNFDAMTERIKETRLPLGFDVAPPPDGFRTHFTKLKELFDDHKPRLVILDACSTSNWLAELQPSVTHELARHVPAVIAMRYPITNDASFQFTHTLYDGLLDGLPVDEAVQRARYDLLRWATGENGGSFRAVGTPVLYVKGSSQLCANLIEPPVESGSTTRQGRSEVLGPCPWCEKPAMWRADSAQCSFCGVRFECPDDVCSAKRPRYSAEQISGPVYFCPGGCGRQFDEPAKPRGSGRPVPQDLPGDQFSRPVPDTGRSEPTTLKSA